MKKGIQETINAFVTDLQPKLVSDEDRSGALMALLKALGPWGVERMSGTSNGEHWTMSIATMDNGTRGMSFSRSSSVTTGMGESRPKEE